MWDNFIGHQIRRCNRNLLIANVLLLGAVVTYATINWRYLANFLSTKTDISTGELANLHNPEERFRFFVRVHGEKVFETGFQSVEQTVDTYSNKVQSTTVKAEYRILAVGGKLLVVKADPSASGTVFTGALESMPSSVYENVVAPAIRDEPRLQGMFVPAILNANDYTEEGWWTIGICVPLLLLAGWNLSKWNKRMRDYSCHPIYRRVICFGTPEEVTQRIEAATRTNAPQKMAGVKLYGPWLFKNSLFGLTFFHVPDIVWVYEKVTRHSVNFIPTGKSFAALLYDRYGYSTEIQAQRNKIVSLMTHIVEQCPWVVAGFSKDAEKLWKSQKSAFVGTVDERRKEFGKAAAVGAGK